MKTTFLFNVILNKSYLVIIFYIILLYKYIFFKFILKNYVWVLGLLLNCIITQYYNNTPYEIYNIYLFIIFFLIVEIIRIIGTTMIQTV